MPASNPSGIVFLYSTGTGNMGDVSTVTSPARFSLDAERFELIGIRGTFSGGSSSASLSIKIDHEKGAQFDATLHTIATVGTGGDQVHFRVTPEEAGHFTLTRGSVFVIEWTNPNTQTWGLEVSLADI